MASENLKHQAHEARLALEEAGIRLEGIHSAHDMLISDAEGDAPLSPDRLYPLFQILADSLAEIRKRIDMADEVLKEVHRQDSPPWCDSPSDANSTDAS
jgi:hypothetical protein